MARDPECDGGGRRLIPRAHVTAWRARVPWPTDAQVEQDLVLSRALVALFADPAVAQAAAFRGGTALHKLFFERPARYSEDIDLVQTAAGAIGTTLDAIRAALDPWLGEPRRTRGQGRVTMLYRFDTTSRPVQRMRLKVEINTREHFTVLGRERRAFAVDNPWFSGRAEVSTYGIEELLGTKLRALYQRQKGRDLYDLWMALTSLDVDDRKVIECFRRYMDEGGVRVSRAELEANLRAKLAAPAFLDDLAPLLAGDVSYDTRAAGALVLERLIAGLPGEPWKGAVS
ncbi:MAG: nucleotidyl transferase AbiEii/AbiGii toxin family protein [Candidatus Binatia bacterium]